MSERKFARGLRKPGTAAQLRETVSQVVKQTAVLNKPQLVEPLDFESFLQKNKTVLQNDPQRELLLYPPDDISEVILPRRCRTLSSPKKRPSPSTHQPVDYTHNLLTRQCLNSYTCNWNLINYKYDAYAGTYADLPNKPCSPLSSSSSQPLYKESGEEMAEETCEIDLDTDAEDDAATKARDITHEGYLMKGAEVGSSFVSIGSKSFKRRYCRLRREIDGTYILEMYKDERKGEAKVTIVMDFCADVVKNPKRGRYCFELRMTGDHKSYVLGTENETEFLKWLSVLSSVLQQNKQHEDKRAASLDRENCASQPLAHPFGTLKGLEQSMNPQLIKYSRETDISIAHARKENRSRLSTLYPPLAVNLRSSSSPSQVNPSEPYRETFPNRVLIRCENIKFRLQAVDHKENLCQVEPYHTTLCLFDAKNGRKLTENFHFDLNASGVRPRTGGGGADTAIHDFLNLPPVGEGHEKMPSDWLFFPRQALISVKNPHPDVFLVVRIEKVLQGGICQSAEAYVKATKDPKVGTKTYRNIASCCQKLGDYRMPFAWACRPLYRLYSNELDTTSDFHAIYRQEPNKLTDEELVKVMTEYRKPDKFSKFTVIPGALSITIRGTTELVPNTLSTSLSPLRPFPVPPTNEPTVEVAEFESNSEKDVHPYTTFVNHLYVYPLNLNFEGQKVFARARNICCTIQVRDSDNEEAKPLQCIYGRPGQPPLVSRASCAVLHHNATPTWYEEVKIRLPKTLLSTHHLLFIFYHISCDLSKNKTNGTATSGPHAASKDNESCVGYAWLPLLHKGMLNVDPQTVPVAAHLPPGYLSVHPFGLGKGNAGPEITWVDGQKALFSFTFNLISTVNTRDRHLFNLFSHAERLFPAPPTTPTSVPPPPPSEVETCKVLKALHAVHPPTLIAFFPTILNQLWELLVMARGEEVGVNVMRVLINLVHMACEAGRRDIVDAYVKFVLVVPSALGVVSKRKTSVHEEVCRCLPVILHPNNTDFLVVNKFMRLGDFFFGVVVKSMAQCLLSSGRIKMHRNERFSADYLANIESLLQILVTYIINKHKEMPTETKELNKSLGRFLKKCLSLIDRGFVFKLVNVYMEKFGSGGDASDSPRSLQEYKFTFIEILCNHEHFVAFNLPIPRNKLSPKNRSPGDNNNNQDFSLCEEFRRQHFLAGLLLQEVSTALNEVPLVRKIALRTLRDLWAKHEMDDRYKNKGQLSRIASLYMPWLGIVLDNCHRLEMEKVEKCAVAANTSAGRMSVSSSFMFGKSSAASDTTFSTTTPKSHRFTLHIDKDSPMHVRNSAFFEAIAGQSMLNGNSLSIDSDLSAASGDAVSQDTTILRDEITAPSDQSSLSTIKNHARTASSAIAHAQLRHDKFQVAETRDVLLVFLMVTKHAGDEQLTAWWQQQSSENIITYFGVLETALRCFRYVGKENVCLVKGRISEDPSASTLSGAAAAAANVKNKRAHTLPARINPAEVENSVATLVIHHRENLLEAEEDEVLRRKQAILEQHLATEIGLVAMDCVGLYCMNFIKKSLCLRSSSTNGDSATDGADELESVVMKILDIFLTLLQIGQGDRLFGHVFASLRAFIDGFSTILFRGDAVACGRLCYELLRCCNSRVSSVRQEACAILYLLMRSNFEFTNRKGITRVHLQVIVSVSQMLGNVVGLNNARFQECLSTINSYASSDKAMKGTGFPVEVKDLTKRIRTVLMATVQMREYNHDPEMLADLQHSLANSYASTPELRHTWLETMARNHVRDGNFSEAVSCQLHVAAMMAEYLKLKGLQAWGAEAFARISSNIERDERGLKMDAGVQDVQYAEIVLLERLETCVQLLDKSERYEVMGELYKLIMPVYEKARNYGTLAKCYQTLAQNYEKIVLANKVRFYGGQWEGEDGMEAAEYVYKEPKVTSLSEISERLERQYSEKLGKDMVKMVHDAAEVDHGNLDPKVAYIQVTHVTPYFEKLEDRQNDFELNHDVDSFMFETPFTKDGRIRGSPEEQWKRRNIIRTERSFPYLKKRIRVCSKRHIDLSPIEVAIDEMQGRVQELEDVVFAAPSDAKKLQLVLQGSVCVQVNAGPLAYASVFLDPALSNMYPEDKVDELKDIYREFLKVCYSGLQVNGTLISHEQHEYQAVLRQNYKELCLSLSNLFGETLWPHDEAGSFERNSMGVFGAVIGASQHSSTA